MTLIQIILLVSATFLLLGAYHTANKAFSLLNDHLERLQAKLETLVVSQAEHNRDRKSVV